MYFKEYIFFLRNTQLNFMFLFSPDTDGRPGSDRQVVVINEQLGKVRRNAAAVAAEVVSSTAVAVEQPPYAATR